MVLRWSLVPAVLWTVLDVFLTSANNSPCAIVARSPSGVIPYGSAVTASCSITEDCGLTKNPGFTVKWDRSGDSIPSSSQDGNVYQLLISNFTVEQEQLHCMICSGNNCQIVGAITVQTARPPPAPQNLTCRLNLAAPCSLLCQWDPGQNILAVPTTYTVWTELLSEPSQMFKYTPPGLQHYVKIPREGFPFFSEVKVWVVAENAVGRASSELVLNPMETAKFDAPVIIGVGAKQHGCLVHTWSLSESQRWISRTLHVELKLTPIHKNQNLKQAPVHVFRAKPGKAEVCGLFHGMTYESRMRVRYHISAPWSEWSQGQLASTPMKAPTGRLITWLKLREQPDGKHQTVQLFWKASAQFRANSMNLSYAVSLKGRGLCSTFLQYCSFPMPTRVRKLYLTAFNAVGKSSPTEVVVHRRRDLEPVASVKAFPESAASVRVEWTSPGADVGYVLEWRAEIETNPDLINFHTVDRNQTSFVISGLEPFVPYEISVYAKYKEGMGQRRSTVTYTREKAPSTSPKLSIGAIRTSYVELFWDETPLQERNGIITEYKVFYWREENDTQVINVEGKKRQVVLKDLHPFSIYDIILMTSTNGGSVNSSVVKVTTSVDAFEMVLMVIPACVGFTLLVFAVFTCVSSQHNWVKKYLWPMIPDPANSNIKKWTTTESLEGFPTFKGFLEPALVYISHFSLLNLSENDPWTGDQNLKPNSKWSHEDESLDMGHDDSSRDSGTFSSELQSESVPYATVVFTEPYHSQPAPPPAYLRSESTQPLLAEEEPSSPPPYDQPSSQAARQKGVVGEAAELRWEDFPMLQSLEITGLHSNTEI